MAARESFDFLYTLFVVLGPIFISKMKRESFTIRDLEDVADALNVDFKRAFILDNGEEV